MHMRSYKKGDFESIEHSFSLNSTTSPREVVAADIKERITGEHVWTCKHKNEVWAICGMVRVVPDDLVFNLWLLRADQAVWSVMDKALLGRTLIKFFNKVCNSSPYDEFLIVASIDDIGFNYKKFAEMNKFIEVEQFFIRRPKIWA